jgi:hypothetical protein
MLHSSQSIAVTLNEFSNREEELATDRAPIFTDQKQENPGFDPCSSSPHPWLNLFLLL